MNDEITPRREDARDHSPCQQEALARFSQEAVSSCNPGALMHRAAQVVHETLGTELSEVLELLPGGSSLRLVAGVGWQDGLVGRATVLAGPGSLAGHALRTCEPVVVDDVRSETRFTVAKSFLDHAVVSVLSVVIPGCNGPLGVLGTYSRQKRSFTTRDGHFLQGVANVLALSLQRGPDDEARRRTEAAAYRHVFESPLIGIAFWSSDGGITEANDEFLRMVGYGRAELEAGAVRWTDLTPPEDLPRIYERLAEVLATGSYPHHEKECVRKDGSRVPVLIGGALFDNTRDQGVCYVVDMTRVKRAERELDRLAARDRAMLENSSDVISIHDANGTMVYQSPSVKPVLGYDEGELIGRKVLDYIHPDDVALSRDRIAQIRSRPGTHPPLVIRFRHKNGEWRWCECTGSNLLDHPAVQGVLFNARDVTDRHLAESELRRSERRYRTLVTATSLLTWTTTPQGEMVPSSDESPLSGRPRAAGAGWGWLDVVHPDDRVRVEQEWREAVVACRPLTSESRVRRPDGGWRKVAVKLVPVECDGKVEEWIGVGEDVTELRRAEEDLRQYERRYRSLTAALYSMVIVIDPRGKVREWSGFGDFVTPSESLTGTLLFDLIHPDDRARSSGRWAETVAAGQPAELAFRVRRQDGAWRQVHARAVPVRGPDGQVEEWVGVIADATDLRRAEEELRRSERRYRSLVTATAQIVWVLSAAGEPVVVHGCEEFFGLTDTAIPIDVWMDHVHPDDRERVQTVMIASIEAERPLLINYRLRRADGKWRQILSRGFPVRDETGRVEEWIGVVADVTEERQLEEQFRQAQKMEAVGLLAAGVAQDFNNLLTVISGYSEMLLTDLTPADPTRALLAEIHRAGERAGTLTRQLLLFSRQQVLEPKVLNLNAVVVDAETMLRRLIGEDVQFSTALAPGLVPVKVDPGQVEQVLLNLCVNARDAMPTGGRLSIETRNVTLDDEYARRHPSVRPGGYSVLAVSDTGTGMDEETKAHIFEPFFTTKGPGKGTGLGLAVVFGVVKQSGGHIEVYTEVGQGTAFKLYFPQVGERVPAPRSSPGLPLMPMGTETILLAEDDEAVRALARHILKACGYTLLEAGDGREAMQMVEGQQGPLDLLISDVVMPHFGGRQLAERVVALRPGLKVLFLSGYTDDAVVRHGVLEAEFAFLQKPFTPSGLAVKVREVLDGGAG